MRTLLKVVFWLALIAAVVAGTYKGWGLLREKHAREVQTPLARENEVPTVGVVTVKRGAVEESVSVTGTVEPDFSALVVPEVPGVLEQFALPDGTPVEEGGEVKQGMVIAVIEHADLEAALRQAEANVSVAEAAVEEAAVVLKDAEREQERARALCERGTATVQQREKAETACEAARVRLHLSQENALLAKTGVEAARLRDQDATVKAPIGGIISRKFVDKGSYVSPAAPLVKIINTDCVQIKGGVPGKAVPLLHPGRTLAHVELDAYPGEGFSVKLDRVQPDLDPATRNAQITLRVPNPEHKLKPGMFARVRVVVTRREDVALIPDAALSSAAGSARVFVVADGKAHVREVKIGLEEGDRNEVLEGLSGGEVVIVRGQHLVREGMEVRTEAREAAE